MTVFARPRALPFLASLALMVGLTACAADDSDPGQAATEGGTSDASSTSGGTTSATSGGTSGTSGSPTTASSGTSSATTSATSETSSSSGTTSGSTTSGSSTTDDGGFITPPDGGVANQCDPRGQDCPEGQKCVAFSNLEGEPWNANKCVDQTGDGQVGDPCNIEGGKYTGVDNCAAGFQCLLTDDDGNDGACVEFCSTDDTCQTAGARCVVYNDGSLPLCLASCDPLLQDCPQGQGCYGSGSSEFICFKFSGDPGTGVRGDECAFVNQCAPGFVCATGGTVDGCTTASCCTVFCDLGDGNPDANCTGGEQCVPFFEAGTAPPQYRDVGICALP